MDWERRLGGRTILPLRPDAPIAIKHDLTNVRVGAGAARFAGAFARTMADPQRSFGLVSVERELARVGQPFVRGERFQGRFDVPSAIRQQLDRQSPLGRAVDLVLRAAERGTPARMLRRLEDALTSDYGEIVEMSVDQPPYRLKYVYLSGSYMAGSSTFSVAPLDDNSCDVTQVFQYQELRLPYVLWLGTSVIKMHSAVVFSQIAQAAASIGAPILSTSIPLPYLKPLQPSKGASVPVPALPTTPA